MALVPVMKSDFSALFEGPVDLVNAVEIYRAFSQGSIVRPLTWGLDAKRTANICIALCVRGLRPRLVLCRSADFVCVRKVWAFVFVRTYDVGHGLYLRLPTKGPGLKRLLKKS